MFSTPPPHSSPIRGTDTQVNPSTAFPSDDAAPRLSVVVITRDEAHNLPRLLDSVRGLADEVVVFDSGSRDGTVELAKAAGARVESCAWEGWSTTKNRANDAARGTWILSLDADEALTPASSDAIRDFISGPVQTAEGAWRVGEINRLTRYVDRWVHHSGWHPDRKVRLWPAGAGAWEGAIHETLRFDGPVVAGRLAGVVEHHSYPSVADHLQQIERFGAVWAESQFAAGRRSSVALALLKVVAQWCKTALLRGGFRDGATGWAIARRSAWATWRKHARLRALHAPPAPPRRVLISRTDALGDLVCTLPLAKALKEAYPDLKVDVLVRPYAAPIAHAAPDIDAVHLWTNDAADDPSNRGALLLQEGGHDAVLFAYPDRAVVRAAHVARIPIRIGTGRRWHTAWRLTHRHWDSRQTSGGHEAWHGLRLLLSLGVDASGDFRWDRHLEAPSPDETVQGWIQSLGPRFVLLHPGSHGSAGNWGGRDFAALARELAAQGQTVGFTGTEAEGQDFKPHLPEEPGIHALFGALDLTQLMALQAHADWVVASSTGPLHTAAALGTPVIGLYYTAAPAWPQRWAPMGPHVTVLTTGSISDSGHLDLSPSEVLRAMRKAP